MEEIINKIIDIDEKAKRLINEQKERQSQLDETIKNEFETKKVVFDIQYKDEIAKEKRKYDEMLNEKKKKIDEKTNDELKKIEKKYTEEEFEIISSIIKNIRHKEE